MSTRNFVPRADQEGNLGTALLRWLKGWFVDLFVSGNLTDGTYNATVANTADAITKKHTQNTDSKIIVGDTSVEIVDTGDGYIIFKEDNVEYIRLTGGNVGIGTSNPTSLLTVNGELEVNGVIRGTGLITPYAQTLTVAKSGGDYTTITAALAAITDAATGKRYCIKVMPGTYTEAATLTLKSYVDIEGSGWWNTIITVADKNLATLVSYIRLSGCTWNVSTQTEARDVLSGGSSSKQDIYIENNKISVSAGNYDTELIAFALNGTGTYQDIYIRNNIIHGFSTTYGMGIHLGNYGGTPTRVYIENNRIELLKWGIIHNLESSTITPCSMVGNNYINTGGHVLWLRLNVDSKFNTCYSYNNTYVTGPITITAGATRTATVNSYGDTVASVARSASGGTETFNGYGSTIGTSPYIDSVGNVGIGTTTPAGKLDVAGKIASSIATDIDFDTDEVLSTGILASYGLLIVRESTSGVTGVFRIENQTIVVISVNALFTITKDSANTYNVYWETDQFKVQNKVGNDKNIKVGFYGL